MECRLWTQWGSCTQELTGALVAWARTAHDQVSQTSSLGLGVGLPGPTLL